MELTWELDLFQADDAPGIVELYREVYGDNYPVKAVYDPAEIIRQDTCGESWRAVARSADGEVVGHVAFYRSSPPNPRLYEHGQLMVRHAYRQTEVAFALMNYALAKIPDRHGLEQIWGEAVCNHLFTQMMTRETGYVETGLEVDLMPAESYTQAFGSVPVSNNRVSTLLVFRSFGSKPQTIYLPTVYEEQLRFIYAAIDAGHRFEPATAPLPAGSTTVAELVNFDGAAVSRITVQVIGADFETRLAQLESEASAACAVVKQVFLRLTEPAIGAAVTILRQRGYFFGGALPRWFDDDGLLMQKTLDEPDFASICLLTKRARQLKEMVRLDRLAVTDLTLGDFLQRRALLFPDKPALIYPLRELTISFAELHAQAGQVAAALLAIGMQPGEHAAIWAPNVPEYLAVEFGAARVGVPLVMINTNYKAFELEYALGQSDTVLLFMADGAARPGEYIETLQQVRSRLPKLRQVVLFGESPAADILPWRQFLAGAATVTAVNLAQRQAQVKPDDIFTLQYTSGTTGAPKGAMVNHFAYLRNPLAMAERQGLRSDDITCVPLPFFHAYGCLVIFSALYFGGAVAVLERFVAPNFLKVLEQSRASQVTGTPTMFVAAREEMKSQPYDLSSLRGGNGAGAVCAPELVRFVIEKMGAHEFCILYGSTEVLGATFTAPGDPLEQRLGSVGRVLPGYEAKIIDPKTGGNLPANTHGELCIRSSSIMTGYYNMPDQTRKALDPDGWLHSGDLAGMDEQGFVAITGRIKDLIIRGGVNIYPAEIEAFLQTHPQVADAQVVGVPCEYYGEEPVCFIRLKRGETVSSLELKKYCRERIAIHKVPVCFFFVDEYPLTASGKVQKFILRELAVQKLAEK